MPEYPSTPADYKIVHFEAGDFKDDHNNTWCNVLFEGYTSEQIRWVVKDPTKPKVGDVVYGHFTNETSKTGKPYIRFRTDQRQQGFTARGPQSASIQSTMDRSDSTQESIARSVALKAAVDFNAGNGGGLKYPEVLEVAKQFLPFLQGSSEASTEARAKLDSLTPEQMDKVVDPKKPWERITNKERRDERDEANDVRQSYGEPLPEEPGDW